MSTTPPIRTFPLLVLALLLTTCASGPLVEDAPSGTTSLAVAHDGLPRALALPPPDAPADDAGHADGQPAADDPPAEEPPAEDVAQPEDAAAADSEDAEVAEHAGGAVDEAVSEVADAVDAVEPAPATPAEPTRVVIPRIGVDNPLGPVGLHPDKSLVVPDEAHVAGWYTGRPRPGETGPAIITGHNQWGGELGVFWDLHELSPGDVIEVRHDDGSVVRFEIDRLEQHPKSDFPTQRVYGPTDRAELRVITCGGHFDQSRRSHVDNVIAFAVRVDQ